MARLFLMTGAVLAALGVAMGAFGAHALKSAVSPERLAVYHTAAQYHLWHALGLLLIGMLAGQGYGTTLLYVAGWLMLVGIVLFSGSLYALVMTEMRALGTITPVGGTALIASWLLVALALFRR